jgi:hypothetical protein
MDQDKDAKLSYLANVLMENRNGVRTSGQLCHPKRGSRHSFSILNRRILTNKKGAIGAHLLMLLEAWVGIEPAYTALQAAA